jgi:leucyl aminopeptidase (aminopeptidase T)
VRADLETHPGWCRNLIAAGSLRAGERVLVVVDEPLVDEGSQLLAAVRDAGANPRLELWSGAGPPVAAAATADLVLFLAREPKVDEAATRLALGEAVTGHGGREIFLAFVDGELLRGELSQPAADLAAVAERLLAELASCDELRVTGSAGTDLRVRVGDRRWITDARPLGPGGVANFPSGEVFVSPLEDSAEGVVVADLTVPFTVEGLVDAPVTLRFERGRAVSIEGGRAAQMLRELVADAGRGADVLAELGIGFNPTIAPRGHVMLDEKAAGTAHVAIGRNTGVYGGTNEASIHVDCVFGGPQVEADGLRVELP